MCGRKRQTVGVFRHSICSLLSLSHPCAKGFALFSSSRLITFKWGICTSAKSSKDSLRQRFVLDADMTGPHEEDRRVGMSGSQLVSGGDTRAGPAKEERGGQATVWVCVCVWGGCSHGNRCPQAGRAAESGGAGGHPGAQWGCRVGVKPSRGLQREHREPHTFICPARHRHALLPVAKACIAKEKSLTHVKPWWDGEGDGMSKPWWCQQSGSSITGFSMSQRTAAQPKASQTRRLQTRKLSAQIPQ